MFIPWNRYDPDSAAYILAVEIADGQHLEVRVRDAINQLVLDLKSNSLWSKVNTMTLLMGARTVAGAMVDLKNPANSWTSTNFVSGDYNRTTGLLGDASTKYLDSGVSDSSIAQDDFSLWVMCSAVGGGSTRYHAGSNASNSGSSALRSDNTTEVRFFSRNGTPNNIASAYAVGLIGSSRAASDSFTARGAQTDSTLTRTSQAASARNIFFFASNSGSGVTQRSNIRIRSGGMGTAMTLSTMETVMDTFVSSITALSL